MDKFIRRQKGVEVQHISVGVGAGADACGKNPIEKKGYKNKEGSLQASTTIHVQGNGNFK